MIATSGYVLSGYGLTLVTLGLYALSVLRRSRGSRWP